MDEDNTKEVVLEDINVGDYRSYRTVEMLEGGRMFFYSTQGAGGNRSKSAFMIYPDEVAKLKQFLMEIDV